MTGTCGPCGAGLDAEQRYCLVCGARRAGAPGLWPGEDPLAALAGPAVPVAGARRSRAPRRPAPRTAGMLSAGVLASGVLVGIGIGPVALGVTEAAQRALVLIVPGAHHASAPVPAPAASALAAPRGAVSAAGPSGSAPATAPAPAPAAPAPAPTTTATTTPGTTTPATTAPAPATTTPATPSGPHVTLRGTVVHQNTFAGSFVLADAKGTLRAVHSATLPALGDVLTVKARALLNGTWADDAALPAAPKRAKTATARGTVTWVDPKSRFYVLSARGTSFVVHRAGAPASASALPAVTTPTVPAVTVPTVPPVTTPTVPLVTTPAVPPTTTPPPELGPPTTDLPAVGDGVEAELTPTPGRTDADPGSVTEVSHRVETTRPATPWDVEGAIVKIDAKAHRLVLSADDSQEERTATFAVTAPAGFRLTLLSPFESVAAHVVPAADDPSTLRLTGLFPDSGPDTADDATGADGDLAKTP